MKSAPLPPVPCRISTALRTTPRCIAPRAAQRAVVDTQPAALAARELKIIQQIVALDRRRPLVRIAGLSA
jgi:hypothetical protein